MTRTAPRAPSSPLARIVEFLRLEAAGGLMLAGAAALGMIWANSPAAGLYHAVLELPISVRAGELALAKPLLLWINDGLMAVFFLLVGLEIKREIVEGALSSREQALLPGIAALGGMIVPALVYLAVTRHDPVAVRGWAIPAATDIAFALAVTALLGARAPRGLKILLSALAIIDDLGAIAIIAVFYTAHLSLLSLCLAGLGLLALGALNVAGVLRLAPYIVIGAFIWVCVLESGVHATLAGVALALAIPVTGDAESGPSHRLERALHGWVSYAILPIFALANAGFSLAGVTPATVQQPIPLGIAAGLILGKPVGVVLASGLAIVLRLARLPAGVGRAQFLGMALLTGIGFTMSLFIGTLAFESVAAQAEVRIGVLAGSLISALAGYLVLRAASGRGATPGK